MELASERVSSFGGLPCGSAGKESACSVGDLGRSLGREDPLKGEAYPLQYSGPEHSKGVAKSQT